MVSTDMLMLGTTRSCIRELFEYGLKQAALFGRENVFDFSLGNPSIPTPPEVSQALTDILTQEDSLAVHSYTVAPGLPEVRAAVAEDLNRRYGAGIRPQDLFLTCGAAPALIAVMRALAVPEAEIAAIAPYFPEYRPFVENSGAVFVSVPADKTNFQIPCEALEAALTPRTQAVILNSPNNPSGVIYSEEILRRTAALLTQKSREFGHPIYIISDEPYRELVYDGAEVPFLPDLYPDTIICYSWSKSLSLPGERIGYVCVPERAADHDELLAAIAGAARASGHVCAPALLQRLVGRCAAVRPDVAAYDANRKALYSALTGFGYECVRPQGAFYLFVKAPGGDAQAFSQHAKAYNLLVVPGNDFGCPDFFRICTCVSGEMIRRSLPAFQKAMETFR